MDLRCPHCEQNIRIALRWHLFIPHERSGGTPCPGGIHGRCRFTIQGDYRRGPRVRDSETPEAFRKRMSWLLLSEALDILSLPDGQVEQMLTAGEIESEWARWGGEAHPVLHRADVEAAYEHTESDRVRAANERRLAEAPRSAGAGGAPTFSDQI